MARVVRRKFMAVILSMAMVLSLIPMVTLSAWAATAANASSNTVLLSASTVTAGTEITITATGDQQDVAGSESGDEKYIPTGWTSNLGGSGSFSYSGSSYTSTYTPTATGTDTITVTFALNTYDGSGWSASTTDTKTADLTVNAAAVSSMVLTQDITAPASNGGNFAQQPVITLKDTYGNICTNDDSTTVTASKNDGGDWTLTGTATQTAVGGIVTFAVLGASNTATVIGAQLKFSSGMLTSVTSGTVTLDASAADTWDGMTAAAFEGGTGTSDDPYVIATAEQLAYMANLINDIGSSSSNYGIYKDKYYTLTSDIDLSGYDWSPIAQLYSNTYYTDTYFHGTFDGHGHTVTLQIDTNVRTTGLFGYTGSDAVIKNLTVNGSINTTNTTTDSIRVGSIVALNRGTISNCTSNASVTGTQTGNTITDPYIYVGGITGANVGSVVGCTSTGDVTGAITVNPKNGVKLYVGGITGINDVNATITNCTSTGDVSGTTVTDNGYSWCYAGGILGSTTYSAGVKMSGCESSGQITCSATAKNGQGHAYAGGFAGLLMQNGLNVEDCSSTCTVSGTASGTGPSPNPGVSADAYADIGGFAGAIAYGVSISDCHSDGNSSGSAISSDGGESDAYIGGFTGTSTLYNGCSCSIDSCYSTGTAQSSAGKNVYAGGLVAYNSEPCSIANSYSTCNVNSDSVVADSISYAGGLIGYNSSLYVSDCYARGAVSGSADSAAYLGGFLGQNTGTVHDGYATGNVSVSGSGTNYIGGLAGLNDSSATIANAYFDSETTGQTAGVGSNSNATDGAVSVTGLTTSQMTGATAKNNMSSLNFTLKWKTQANTATYWYYPQLQSFSGFGSVALKVSSGYSSGGSPSSSSNGTPVLINGEEQTAGTTKTITSGGVTTTTVTLTADDIEDLLDGVSSSPTVTIPILTDSDVSTGRLDGQAVSNMADMDAVLVIDTGSVTYTIPASEIDIDAISEQFGESVSLDDITVNVSISEPSDAMVTAVDNAAAEGGFTIQIPAVEFTITCEYNGQTIEVETFDAYVQRLVAIPDSVDPTKITTAVVVNADGITHHVPTSVSLINGKYYAVINSLTNSTYSVVWNPVEFSDVTNHWAKDTVNNMGSRMVVFGDNNGNYNPDNNITRAEFATIIIRALGLTPGTGESGFDDVASTDWYCGYVETAAGYGIITGYPDGSFGPDDTITREQAMVMIARAMKITGLEVNLTDSEINELLGTYSDGATAMDYAKTGIAACIQTGIVSGRGNGTIAPKDYVTRAEVAVMVEKMLQKSELI